MFTKKKTRSGYRGDGNGYCWPTTQVGSGTVRDIFGPRPFASHIPTVGYDYDIHRGIDIIAELDDPLYSPMAGAINRLHYTHFWWDDNTQLDQWIETDASSSAVFAISGTALQVTAQRTGSADFPAGVARISAARERVIIQDGDWSIQMELSQTIGVTGGIGVGIYDTANEEYVALEYDGSVFTTRGFDSSGSMTNDGFTSSSSDKTWMRIEYSQSVDTLFWRCGTDGESWSDITSEATHDFSDKLTAVFEPMVYWRSADVDASPYDILIDKVEWVDTQTIGRFGNWLSVSNENERVLMMHMRSFVGDIGDFVHAGQQIGYVGTTGYDVRSGRILLPHVHVEYLNGNSYFYSNDDPMNPLDPSLLPRANVSNNVSSSVTFNADPDGIDSWKLDIFVSRATEDFDLNQIQLTGSATSRAVNFNTRAGLNDDVDIPVVSGVYIVPQDFDEFDSQYNVALYFHTATVGSTFTAYEIKDTQGTLLDSE